MTTDLMEFQEKLGIAPGKKKLDKMDRLVFASGDRGRWSGILGSQKEERHPRGGGGSALSHPACEEGRSYRHCFGHRQLKPTRTVDVGSQVSGIIDEVLVNYNDPVKAGQVICRLNTDKLEAQVSLDKAQLAAAKANVDSAKVTVAADEAYYKQILDAQQRSKPT